MEDKEKILTEVIEIIREVSENVDVTINEDTILYDELGIDSLKGLEVSVRVQKKYKVKFKPEDAVKLTTPGAFVQEIKNQLN